MTYQIQALAAEPFAPYFALSETELSARNIHKQTVDTAFGTPCRVSLEDAQVGETVLLLNYQHLKAQSPYAASHAIYVRQGAKQAQPEPGTVPQMLRRRLLSVRLFSADDMIIDADVLDGAHLDKYLRSAFARTEVAFCHVHNAKFGCFAAAVRRINRP